MKNKQVFKGQQLSRTQVKNNILRIWNQTIDSDRFDWYQEAHNEAVKLASMQFVGPFGGPLKPDLVRACGVIAALSPVKLWSQNLVCARNLYEGNKIGHMKQFENKAMAIYNSDGSEEEVIEILKGNKIVSFFLNILHPEKADMVTIDRHALSVALGEWVTEDTYSGMTNIQYEFFVQCYKWAALQINVSPVLLQSATWVRFRKIKGEYKRR